MCVYRERERDESTMNDIFVQKYWTNQRVYQDSFFFKEMGPEAIMGQRPTIDLDESLSLIVTTIRKQQIWILGAALYWTSKAFLLILYLMVTPCNDRIESNHRVAHSIANVNRTSMPRNLTLYSCALLQKDRYQVRANTNIKMIRNLMTMMIIIRKILP